MAKDEKKLHSFTSFNSGEYSPYLAGRVDLESFGSSTRHVSNMMSQVSGGLKKFYGTEHVAEIPRKNNQNKIKLVPFINRHEPMAFVFWGIEDSGGYQPEGISIGLIYGNKYKELPIRFPTSVDVDEMRWQQINDVVIFVHESTQPISINFYGVDENGEYLFNTNVLNFVDIPYFPLNFANEYRGTLSADGIVGEITLTAADSNVDIKSYFPAPLDYQSTYTRERIFDHALNSLVYTYAKSTILLLRLRGNVETVLASDTCNVTSRPEHDGRYYVRDTITRESILRVIQTRYSGSYIESNAVVLKGVSDHKDGDSYYMRINIGQGGTAAEPETYYPPQTNNSVLFTPPSTTVAGFDAETLVGRKIKFYLDETFAVEPWWQGKEVKTGDYVYSNGHWYKAESAGKCGNIQPSHTLGTRSDGVVGWRYVHSGTGTATIISVLDSNNIKALVNSAELPANKVNDTYVFNNYAWSIWGHRGVHPSEVYMADNRLGFVCNTDGFGAWNSLSVTDDYYNFSTEEYGQQLDTSAIVNLIGNNESGQISWVLSRNTVFMGSYSGEYSIKSNENSGLTPIGTVVKNISNIGSRNISPLKYKELNLFVGPTGKELYTIGYDQYIDDYKPKSLGHLTQHIMEMGIKRMEALNNLDRNIYLLHDTNCVSLFNYVGDQNIMGFSKLDFGASVLDFATTYSKDVVAGYAVTERTAEKITIERVADYKPAFMFDVINVKSDGKSTQLPAVPHHANKEVWVVCSDGSFVKAKLDSDGKATGVPPSIGYSVGLPMVCELHTQPSFGGKVEGMQQQSVSVYLRLYNSGAFSYGCSVDFDKYFDYDSWSDRQGFDNKRVLYTGDCALNIPLGYTKADNQGDGRYPNTMSVGINIKSDTPEPFNLLSIQEIYK